jgi:hypothetical protein
MANEPVADPRKGGRIERPFALRAAGHGATRLSAPKLESWTETDAQVLGGSEVDYEKAELAEPGPQ